MNRKEYLAKAIEEQKALLKPLEDELTQIYIKEGENVETKVQNCYQGKDKFTLDELVFSACVECPCGAGMAYPKGIGAFGSWHCSAMLTGTLDKFKKVTHYGEIPFTTSNIKSENQPSANGLTTRPKE